MDTFNISLKKNKRLVDIMIKNEVETAIVDFQLLRL